MRRRFDLPSAMALGGTFLFIACLYVSPGDLFPAVAVAHPALLSAGTMLSGLVLMRVLAGQRLRIAGGVGVAMAGLFGLAGLSSLWALDPALALGFCLGGVKLLAVFVALTSILRSPRQIRTAMTVAVVASIVPAWGTISRYRNGIGLVEGFRGSWVGLLANPNALAMVMAVTIPWAIILANRSRPWLKPVFLLALGLEVGAIVATHSRGGTLGLAGALLATAFLAQRRLRAMGLVLVAAIAVLALAPQTFWARTETIGHYEQDASARGRLQSWHVGLRALNDNPLLGVGANNYTDAWDVYAARNVREKSYASHNMWIQVLVELGLLGAGLFLTMFALLLRGLWSARRHPELGPLARPLLASLIALVICGTTGGYAFNWFFYMLLGLAGAVISSARECPEEGRADAVEITLA